MLLDKTSGLFYGDETAKFWLQTHEGAWDNFCRRYKFRERDELKRKMYNAPLITMRAIKDFKSSDFRKTEKIKERIRNARGEVWLCAGKKGGGKTWVCYLLLEWAKEMGRECYVAAPPLKIPNWTTRVSDPAAAPIDSVVYISEGAIQYSARTSMVASQRDALSILPILRHSGRLIIVESQSTKIIDIALLRMMDAIILKQEPLYSDERHPLRFVLDILKPKRKEETLFFFGDDFCFLKATPRPKCWSDDLSLAWHPIQQEDEAMKYGADLLEQGASPREIRRVLIARSFRRPLDWWLETLGLTEKVYVTEEPMLVQAQPPPPQIKVQNSARENKKTKVEKVTKGVIGQL